MVHTSAITVAAAALLTALPVNAGLYSKSSPVLQVDAKNYDRLIAQSNYTSVFLHSSYFLCSPETELTYPSPDPRILRPLVRPLQEPPTRLRESRKIPLRPGQGSSH